MMRFILIAIFMSFSLVCGCATSQSSIGGFNLISVDEEKQLGDKLAVEVQKQYKVVNDATVQAYIDRVGKRLLTGVRKVEFPFTFQVIEDPSVNAFAIPGGHTYIQTGLIKAAATEDELAAVMAHEINHVVARHGTQQLTKQYGYEMIAGLLLGNQAGIAKMAADLFGKAGLLYYSRAMETQADYLGVETMYNAGYDPHGMVTFFEKLQAEAKSNPGKVAKFFSTHPPTPERIQDIEQEIAKLPPKKFPPESETDFNNVKARIKNL